VSRRRDALQVAVRARPWALPVLVALVPPPEWDRVHGTRHETPAHLARLLLACLVRWFPKRHFLFVGDTGDGTNETARFAVSAIVISPSSASVLVMPPCMRLRHRARVT
jgi:hypothetical protein